MTDLPERLREAAHAHRPDRERMLARVEHAMTADGTGSGAPDSAARGHDRPVAAPWMRVTAVTAAVAGAIGIGGLAVGAVTGTNQPGHSSVTSDSADPAPPSPIASGSTGGGERRVPVQRHSTTPSAHRKSPGPRNTAGRGTTTPPLQAAPPSVPGSPPHSSGPSSAGTGLPQGSGPLQSDGVLGSNSDAYWTESDVRLTSQKPITSLTVELRIARVNGETYSASWTDATQVSVKVTTEADYIVYRWTLAAGQTLPADTYSFAGQFTHDPGQGGTDGDRYTATAGYATGGSVTVGGGF
ncbi:hypothetical protein [Streptomyces sp. NRRL F-5123]|uniref:hypothetical protein n=1 Tax=Streptomyces sp. NRRL F-5123 TaxID=1463856 RepID=UPI0004E12657|nr:hypothetical protein [Streptomyces sp. NRRL F-5123]